MSADSHYAKGWTHLVCQDYAAHGKFKTPQSGDEPLITHWGLVCDGCSTSDDTDIGARLLSCAAKKNLLGLRAILDCLEAEGGNYLGSVNTIWEEYVRQAAECAAVWSRDMGLGSKSVDATLLACFADKKWSCTASYGDGMHVVKRRVGTDRVIEIEYVSFPRSYPPYPSYLLDETRMQKFNELDGNEKKVIRWSSEGEIEETEGGNPSHLLCYPTDEVEFIAVSSDGVSSFDGLPCQDVAQALVQFKNYAGEFVKRRMHRALEELYKAHHVPSDDVSLATVHTGYGHAV
ncbi:MAG: hypothetical protein JSS66_05440 [Armatimonadetes bacterium]|nr:hypothetical protein [Armatimonadota bacterium]